MIAEYNGIKYHAILHKENIKLITCRKDKLQAGFLSKAGRFSKIISFDDPAFTSLYVIRYFVEYRDKAEGQQSWPIYHTCSAWPESDIRDGTVTINVPHEPKDSSWLQCDRCLSSKAIRLADCSSFHIETEELWPERKTGIRTLTMTDFIDTILKNKEDER